MFVVILGVVGFGGDLFMIVIGHRVWGILILGFGSRQTAVMLGVWIVIDSL